MISNMLLRIERLAPLVWEQKLPFLGVFFGIVLVTYGCLYAIDFIPEAPERESEAVVPAASTDEVPAATGEESKGTDATPDRIIIDALDREIPVLNPESSSVAVLDNALLSGVVRHPQSADLLEEGTMLIFGHSSYLPNVINKNFQALNGIAKLVYGDTIRLQSGDFEYVYRVDRVYEAKASTAEIKIPQGKAKLTLVTCNSFGSKEDRFIVEATLIDSYAL